jgi:hypothetical protein
MPTPTPFAPALPGPGTLLQPRPDHLGRWLLLSLRRLPGGRARVHATQPQQPQEQRRAAWRLQRPAGRADPLARYLRDSEATRLASQLEARGRALEAQLRARLANATICRALRALERARARQVGGWVRSSRPERRGGTGACCGGAAGAAAGRPPPGVLARRALAAPGLGAAQPLTRRAGPHPQAGR